MDDIEGEHCKEVYARFGVAYYLANCLEQTMVSALIQLDHFTKKLAERASNFDQTAFREGVDAFEGKHQRLTLGILIERLVVLAPLSGDMNTDLRQALKRRNFLAHHFFRERALDFMSEAGRDAMKAELETDMALFERVDDALHAFLKPHRERIGLSDEALAPRIQQFLEENSLDPDLFAH